MTWVNLLIHCVLKSSNNKEQLLTSLVNSQAILLDTLVDEKRKKTITKSALVDVRRTIRHNATVIPDLFESAFANAATATPSYRNAVLIGTIVDVSLRLKQPKGIDGKALIDQQKVTDYYLKNVVSARTAAPTPVLDAFGDFISTFVDHDTFTKDFLPTFDKMMLRSPEVASRGKLQQSSMGFFFKKKEKRDWVCMHLIGIGC